MRKFKLYALLCGMLLPALGYAADDTSFTIELDGIFYKLYPDPDRLVPYYDLAVVVARPDGKPYDMTEFNVPISFDYEYKGVDEWGDEYVTEKFFVGEIEGNAFKDAANLKTVNIDGRIYIRPYAFNGCPNLEEVNINVRNVPMHLQSYMAVSGFTNCPKLEVINLDGDGLWINDDCTTGFENVKKVICKGICRFQSTAGEQKERADSYPVKPDMEIDWENATNISVGSNSLTWFTGEKIVLSKNVRLSFDFMGSTGAKHVKTLEFGTMAANSYDNNNLYSIIRAFKDCKLEKIIFRDETMLAHNEDLVFEDADVMKGITLYVPQGSIDKFRTHAVWGKYGTILPIEDGVECIVSDGDTDSPVEYYNLHGVKVDNPQPGNVVVRRQGATSTKVIVK